jgi:hypothetical protein
MKTRQEMIYEFMLALCANSEMTSEDLDPNDIATIIFHQAASLADEILGRL